MTGVGSGIGNLFIASWFPSGVRVEIGFVLRIVIPGSGDELKGRIDWEAKVGSIAEFHGAQLQERRERTIVLAVIRGLITELQGEGPGVVSQIAKGDGGEDGSRTGGRIRVLGSGHFQFKAGGLNFPHAEETPAGGGHGLDQGGFGGVARLELGEQRRREVVETARGFTLENHRAGEKVAGGVLRRGSFAFGCDRAGGFGGVGSIRLDLTFSCHGGLRILGSRGGGWV